MSELRTVDDLRAIYREPGDVVRAKITDRLDDNCRQFLARCPFVVVATADADGHCDASPRGGPPGFVRVVDDHHLAWADLAGNNLLDTFQNAVANPGVGLLCLVPGRDETLRVNGRATLTTDLATRELVEIDGRVPKVAVVVEVAEAYIHCAKAFRRSGLWDQPSWPDLTDLPSAACMIRDHTRFDVDPQLIEDGLEANYSATLWESGGSA